MTAKSKKLFSSLALGAILIVCFQNFSAIPIEKLKLARLSLVQQAHARAALDTSANLGTADIRQLAPHRPPEMDRVGASALVTPQNGTDLGSVGQDWISRQANAITGGAEQRFFDDINKKMNRAMNFQSASTDKSRSSSSSSGSTGEISAQGGRGPASIDSPSFAPAAATQTSGSDENNYMGFKPKSLRVTAVNRFELDLANRTNVKCSIGNSVQVDVSRAVSERMDVNVRHESENNTNTVRLHYSW